MQSSEKTINGKKREAVETIVSAAQMLHAININRVDVNMKLFKEIVTEIACSANRLAIIANELETKGEHP